MNKNIRLLIDQPFILDDQLEMTLLFIIEEWIGNERKVEMNIIINMKTPQVEEEITFSSIMDQYFEWHGYKFEYYGGGRKEVHLKLIKTGKIES